MKWYNQILKPIAGAVFEVEKVDEQTAKQRYQVCKSCDKYDQSEDKCTVCGCFMETKTAMKIHNNFFKNRLEATHCPLGRWGAEDKQIANEYRALDGLEKIQ